jgi:hypothetical protein
MMLNEQRDLLGRVISLETKSQQQEDEIVCLKSALSDVIRRLQAVESGKGRSFIGSCLLWNELIYFSLYDHTNFTIC